MPAFAACGYRHVVDVRSDAQLALAASSGDREALGAIYDRYSDTLYELCRAVLRDAHEASDALQDTFVIAATRLKGLREPDRLKPWLCAIARHESMRRSSKRARSRPSHDEVLDVPVIDNSADGLMADDAASLVWEAAEALTDRERALLMLNVRQGLEGAELAEAAGLDGATASVVLSRAKTQLAAAVRCTLLIRNGRNDCEELKSIVPHAHAVLDGLTRKRVTRHAASCEICEPKWNASPNALGVLAAAPLLGAPKLKDTILNDPRLISNSRPLGGRGWSRDGWPPAEEKPRRRVYASVAAALIAIVVASALLLAGDNKTPVLGRIDTDSNTTLATGATTTPSTEPGATTTSSRRTTTTIKKPTTATTIKPPVGGTAPTTPTTAAPTTTTAPGLQISAQSRTNTLSSCGDGTSTGITASTNGSPQILWLNIQKGNTFHSGPMTKNGANWSGQIGPYTMPGQITWWVSEKSGGGGARSNPGSITVEPCPQ